MKTYRSVMWVTGSDGLLKEIEVKYTQTFWQWLLSKPATKYHWEAVDGSIGWVRKGKNGVVPVDSGKEARLILEALDYIGKSQRFLRWYK